MGKGPQPKMAEKWAAKWLAAISRGGGGGSQHGRKMVGELAGYAENRQNFGCLIIVRPFRTPPLTFF